jgi:hypothetical protein
VIQKKGICEQCNDGKEKPIVKKLCQYHYWQSKRKPVNKVSAKRKVQNEIYSELRRIFLNKNPTCQGQYEGCTYNATDVHHLRGRVGDLFLDTRYWQALCRSCHLHCHDNNIKS